MTHLTYSPKRDYTREEITQALQGYGLTDLALLEQVLTQLDELSATYKHNGSIDVEIGDQLSWEANWNLIEFETMVGKRTMVKIGWFADAPDPDAKVLVYPLDFYLWWDNVSVVQRIGLAEQALLGLSAAELQAIGSKDTDHLTEVLSHSDIRDLAKSWAH